MKYKKVMSLTQGRALNDARTEEARKQVLAEHASAKAERIGAPQRPLRIIWLRDFDEGIVTWIRRDEKRKKSHLLNYGFPSSK